MNECFWYEKPTENKKERIIGWQLKTKWVAFCDRCKKAQDEFDKELEELKQEKLRVQGSNLRPID